MQSVRYIAVVFLMIVMATPVIAVGGAHLPVGDQIVISTNDSQCRAFIFGPTTKMLEGSKDSCYIHITSGMSYELPEGEYKMFLQYTGDNGMFDIGYDGSKFTSIYKNIRDIDVSNSTEDRKLEAFYSIRGTLTDDRFVESVLYVELPSITLTNMYTKDNGDLHLDFSTNLFEGNAISAMIEPDLYKGTPFYKLMHNDSVVRYTPTGNKFWLEFPVDAANQLTTGQHVIYITYMGNMVMSIPFKRYTRMVPPTPTPEIQHYYSFTGEEMGYRVNTTRVSTPTPTPTIYVTPTYVTALTESRKDRVINQRDVIYIGEKNLDVSLAVGWQDPSTSNYNFVITWCDGDGSEYVIPNEKHFDVDSSVFSNREGAWCHKGDDREPIVAFFVKRGYYGNVSVRDPIPTVNATIAPSNHSYAVVEGEATTPIPTTTPIPVPTTETITLPVPIWIVVAAIVSALVMRRQDP